MIHAIRDIVNMYIAMLLQHVLKWPYALRVSIGVMFTVLAGYTVIWMVFFIIRKYGVPLIFNILKYIIYLLQLLAFVIVRFSSGQHERLTKFDEALNAFGIRLGKWRERVQVKNSGKSRKVLAVVSGLAFFCTVIFVIVPYYMELSVSGNAREICARINNVTDEIQEKIQNYADQYYILDESADSENRREEETETDVGENEKYVLYLGREGIYGANLRNSPQKIEGNVITSVSGGVKLIYENEIVNDGKIIWLKVSTGDIAEAWISKKLIREEDLKAAGIE